MSKSKKKRVHHDSDDDDVYDDLPYMGNKKPVAPSNEMQGGVNKTSTGLSPDVHGSVVAALLGPLGHEGAEAAGPLRALQECVAPARIADALFERRCSERGFSSSQMAKQLNIIDSVIGANRFDCTVLRKEMAEAFEKMPQRFRFAHRTGELSLTDRQSQLGCFFLSAEPPSEEVRKLYSEKLGKVWKDHYRDVAGTSQVRQDVNRLLDEGTPEAADSAALLLATRISH